MNVQHGMTATLMFLSFSHFHIFRCLVENEFHFGSMWETWELFNQFVMVKWNEQSLDPHYTFDGKMIFNSTSNSNSASTRINRPDRNNTRNIIHDESAFTWSSFSTLNARSHLHTILMGRKSQNGTGAQQKEETTN